MTLRPHFEVVQAELQAVDESQSDEIAAIGFDGERIIVQFHRFAGLFAAAATREQYETLVDAVKIETQFSAKIADVMPMPLAQRWYTLSPFKHRKRRR
jgi:hypothetical protein